jgi:hypothetical protein
VYKNSCQIQLSKFKEHNISVFFGIAKQEKLIHKLISSKHQLSLSAFIIAGFLTYLFTDPFWDDGVGVVLLYHCLPTGVRDSILGV